MTVRHDDGLWSEYIHLGAVAVTEGQTVPQGGLLGASGDAGFAPEPHLHVQVAGSGAADAATVPWALRGRAGGGGGGLVAVVPAAGRWYDACGEHAAADGPGGGGGGGL